MSFDVISISTIPSFYTFSYRYLVRYEVRHINGTEKFLKPCIMRQTDLEKNVKKYRNELTVTVSVFIQNQIDFPIVQLSDKFAF